MKFYARVVFWPLCYEFDHWEHYLEYDQYTDILKNADMLAPLS